MKQNALAVQPDKAMTATQEALMHEFVTMFIDRQLFGIPVLVVQDVLGLQKITRVPLAPPEVAGSLNLRGRIVTAIDVRTRLDLPKNEDNAHSMSVVVDFNNELYSLIVDQVGEVMTLAQADYEKTPATLDERWREISDGVYRLKDTLLIVLDVKKLLRLDSVAS